MPELPKLPLHSRFGGFGNLASGRSVLAHRPPSREAPPSHRLSKARAQHPAKKHSAQDNSEPGHFRETVPDFLLNYRNKIPCIGCGTISLSISDSPIGVERHESRFPNASAFNPTIGDTHDST